MPTNEIGLVYKKMAVLYLNIFVFWSVCCAYNFNSFKSDLCIASNVPIADVGTTYNCLHMNKMHILITRNIFKYWIKILLNHML